MNSRLDCLRLVRTEGVGPITFRRLLERYPTPAEALAALPGLARAGGRRTLRVASVADVERELDGISAIGARLLFFGDPDYPDLFRQTEGAPPALTVRGDPAILGRRAVGLVGARNASSNGKHMAELLAYDLAESGLVVVSGLARGIDTAAHVGALRAGLTVAAVAGGVDVAYPPQNAALQDRIAEAGAVVAEAPLGTAPLARHFPKRNRVIAALSMGVVVVEAAPNSGSLITARFAAEMGRELFAVPGSPLDPRARGSNDLIRTGAHLVESAADVLAVLPNYGAPLRPHAVAEPVERFEPLADGDAVRRTLLEHLSFDPADLDTVIRRSGLPAGAAQSALLELELGGRVGVLPGNRVCLLHQ